MQTQIEAAWWRVGGMLALLMFLANCAAQPATGNPTALALPAGYQATTIITGLQGPTQIIAGPGGTLWVAQLAGAENASSGQIIAVAPSGAQRVLLDNLFKPTGIALLANALWIASGRDLLRAPLASGGVGAPETIFKDLPYNGRSNGTLTVTPDQKLLYETSGRRTGNTNEQGSATLWQLDPANPREPQVLAIGLKGAYAHTYDRDGRLWASEIGDDPVDDGTPPDEINLIADGGDYGFPQCFGNREPARNYAGTVARCATTRAPVALFAPHATPTSVAASPWEPNMLFVALWARGEVVQVRLAANHSEAPAKIEPFLAGMANPQHLLVQADGSLLLSEFGTGTIYRITKQ